MADEKTRPFQMRVSPDWLEMIDEWRRKQADLPSRAEAIRRLVNIALTHPASQRPRRLSDLTEDILARQIEAEGGFSTLRKLD